MIIRTICALIIFIQTASANLDIDPNGYILYCPCMGRFGNQADNFLGALGFAYGINRTLVLPPWVEYRYGEPRSIQVPFDTYFQVQPLTKYHRVITMETFMKFLATKVWPPEERVSFCYVNRDPQKGCNAKEGNPFGPFWDTFKVNFVKSEFYAPLHYDTYHHNMAEKWNDKYPGDKWPVMAFTGAPASFPVQLENRGLHQHLVWNKNMTDLAQQFIKMRLPKGAFIGIHLRNGIDWVRACEHVPHSPNLFAAPQCLGYRNERGKVTPELCMPNKDIIVKQLKRVIKNMKTVKSVFVASDSNHMIADLSDALKRTGVSVHKLDVPDPHLELVILGLSNHFIGNCVSSFSAFVKRARDVHGFPSSFWAFPIDKQYRDEL